jgi:transcription termination/antitermination protein NusA
MEVVVPDDQLSLAIGKRGQNVRLAHRLSGWKIDLRSDSEAEEEARAARASLNAIPGIGDINAELLYQWGFRTAEQLAETAEESFEVEGISPERARQLIMAAREWVAKKHVDEEAAAVAAAHAAAEKAEVDAAAAAAAAADVLADAADGSVENGGDSASVSEEEDAAAKS